MKVRLKCDTSDAADAHRALGSWLDEIDAGELDGDEALAALASVVDLIDAQRSALRRALGS